MFTDYPTATAAVHNHVTTSSTDGRSLTPADAAHRYAAYGWPVFPCQAGTKIPATRHGFHDATTDPDQIARWWHAHPEYNVAIRTGAPGPDVLDIDVRINYDAGTYNTGYHSLAVLQGAGLINECTTMVRTRNGGLHIYFPGTDQRCRSLRERLVDFKATGGYVLAPPSQVPADPGVERMSSYPVGAYQLIDYRSGGRPLDWANVERLFTPKTPTIPQPRRPVTPRDQHAAIRGLVRTVRAAQTGNRNHALYYAGRRAREHVDAGRLDHDYAWAQLVAAARDVGLPAAEIARTLRSALGSTR